MDIPTDSGRHQSARGISIGWIILAILVLLGTQVPSAIWAFRNHIPHHWDNADYLNMAWLDYYAFHAGGPLHDHPTGLHGLWLSILNLDVFRPPAYRIVTAPFILLTTPTLATLRAVSIVFFWLTLLVIYRIGPTVIDGLAGHIAGLLATMLVSLFLEIGWSIRIYGTEFTLYFATALVLLSLARATRANGKSHWTWIGLGAGLGLGFLSKMSFMFLGIPVIILTTAFIWRGWLPGLSIRKMIGAGLICGWMNEAYYGRHLVTAYRYGREMTHFSRHSLHRHGLELIGAWLKLHLTEGMGIAAGIILIGLGVLAAIIGAARWLRCHSSFSPSSPGPAGMMILISLAMALLLPIFQLLLSDSDNTRHITPCYIPLAVAVTLAAGATGILTSRWSWAVLIAVAFGSTWQIRTDFLPLAVWKSDVWDWEPLHAASAEHQIKSPRLAYLGNGLEFNQAFIIAPWVRRNEAVDAQWIWRGEEGPASIDWNKLMSALDNKDIVLTAPKIQIPGDASMLADPVASDNSHNAEFADRLMRDPGFEEPVKFSIGTVNKAEMWVFFRRRGQGK